MQIWDGLALGFRVLVLQVLALVLALLLPGARPGARLADRGWAIGRGLFVAVAMRRMDRAQAQQRCIAACGSPCWCRAA